MLKVLYHSQAGIQGPSKLHLASIVVDSRVASYTPVREPSTRCSTGNTQTAIKMNNGSTKDLNIITQIYSIIKLLRNVLNIK